MIPILTPEEMAAVDRAATVPTDVLVARAGGAVARAGLALMGGAYGRRVVVVAGKGNNGADGRVAAKWLQRRGARVEVLDAASAPDRLPASDLVIDAAYGTGFRGTYAAPDPLGAPVLAVDIPSGVDGLTGEADDGAVQAERTVTFAALKPGLLLDPGRGRAGVTELVDIGLDVPSSPTNLVEASDVAAWLPRRPRESHKWLSAVWVAAGSKGMTGAAEMAAAAALRSGAGTVRLGVPGGDAGGARPEVVRIAIPEEGWHERVLADLGRFKAVVVGPGLGREEPTAGEVRALLRGAPDTPVVVDADALTALGEVSDAAPLLKSRRAATVLTPHEGEFRRLMGAKPGGDRLAAARRLAAESAATVLLKGSTTVVADPSGQVLVSTAGDARLATAGSGDVLAGVLGAFLAQGLDGLRAAGAAALVHGMAAHLGWSRGLLAGDLLDLLPAVLSDLPERPRG